MTAPIFISHARKDARIAQTVCDALEQRGFACWIAARDVEGGENFQVSIVRAIRTAKVLILIFSANANNSDEIKKEVVLAGQNRLVVIPVRIEEVEPDEALAYELSTRQWIDYFENREAALQRLMRRLETIPGATRIEPAASGPSNSALAEKIEGSSPAFRGSGGSAETGSRVQISPGLANWPAWELISWRKGLAGTIGVGAIGAAIWGITVGVDSSITPHRSPTSDWAPAFEAIPNLRAPDKTSAVPRKSGDYGPPDSVLRGTLSSEALGKAPVAPKIELSPTPGAAPSASDEPANAANASAVSARVQPVVISPRDAKINLTVLGFYDSYIDDQEDESLRAAVMAFQKAAGLPADGFVKGTTIAMLQNAYFRRARNPYKSE